jgi:hypothetical protein
MDYVGWRDVRTATRYVDPGEAFAEWRRDKPSNSK